MKKLVLLFSLAISPFAHSAELTIDGETRSIVEVFAASRLEDGRVTNQFMERVTSIRFIPGHKWSQTNQALSLKYWPMSGKYFKILFPGSDTLPYYVLEEARLIGEDNTRFGSIEFVWYFHQIPRNHGGPNPNFWPSVAKTIIDAADMQYRHQRLVCLEMTGKLILSNAVQKKDVNDIGQTKYKIVFIPDRAEIIGFVDASTTEVTPLQ